MSLKRVESKGKEGRRGVYMTSPGEDCQELIRTCLSKKDPGRSPVVM